MRATESHHRNRWRLYCAKRGNGLFLVHSLCRALRCVEIPIPKPGICARSSPSNSSFLVDLSILARKLWCDKNCLTETGGRSTLAEAAKKLRFPFPFPTGSIGGKQETTFACHARPRWRSHRSLSLSASSHRCKAPEGRCPPDPLAFSAWTLHSQVCRAHR